MLKIKFLILPIKQGIRKLNKQNNFSDKYIKIVCKKCIVYFIDDIFDENVRKMSCMILQIGV